MGAFDGWCGCGFSANLYHLHVCGFFSLQFCTLDWILFFDRGEEDRGEEDRGEEVQKKETNKESFCWSWDYFHDQDAEDYYYNKHCKR